MFEDDLFDHLTPRGTIEYALPNVHIPKDNPEPVVLLLKFGGRGSPFFNAMLKAPPVADKQAAYERLAQMAVKHLIGGWKNVQKDGKPVPYTPELGEEVLTKLVKAKRGDKVEDMTAHAMGGDSFADLVVDPVDLGKG
jgi:hypothetical protein